MEISNTENHFLNAPQIKIERSMFPRKFETKTTFNHGQLIPVMMDQEVTFGDTITAEISGVYRTLTPLNPTMDNGRLDIYAYHTPCLQIWKHYKEFHGENTIGAWKDTRNFHIPQLKVCFMRWLTSAFPVELTLKIECNSPLSPTTVLPSTTVTHASLREAIIKALDTDSEYVYRNLLMKYYQWFSLMDYFGITNEAANADLQEKDTTITKTWTYNTQVTLTWSYANGITTANLLVNQDPSGSETELNVEKVTDLINTAFDSWEADAANADCFIYDEISDMPYRAYQRIFDQAFRNQNYVEPIDIEVYNGDATFRCGPEPYKGGMPERVNRQADYLSTGLPEPQKGDPILTPLGTSAPVIGADKALIIENQLSRTDGILDVYGPNAGETLLANAAMNKASDGWNVTQDPTKTTLFADLSRAVAATINAQRLAFAAQRIEEKDARGGTYFSDIARSHFSVDYINPLEIQVPEYLGGESIPTNIKQIDQTSETATTPLGETGANSLTGFKKQLFTKSFVQPAIVMILIATRTDRTYCQGNDRSWYKKERLDFYYPALAFLGEQPVYNREIYATGGTTDKEVWAYQERWAEMRTDKKLLTGAMRTIYPQSLDVWHYGDKYETLPVLSEQWLKEDSKRLGRTLIYEENTSRQYIGDFLTRCKYYRPMPVNSIPGLIDHY